MSIRKNYNVKNVRIGNLLTEKRKNICCGSREKFIDERSRTIFNDEAWISLRHLANLEEGKTLPSIEMLINLAYAFEENPEDLFIEIYDILRS